MDGHHEIALTRRHLLAGAGALVVGFSLAGRGFAQDNNAAPKLPGSLADSPMLDSWIRIDGEGVITVLTGKAELGQGVRTALIQIAAEELAVDPAEIRLVTADTGQTPDEGYTAGSQSMQNSGTAIRNAAAQVRELLAEEAARRLNTAPDQLRAEQKKLTGPDGHSLTYGELAESMDLHVGPHPPRR
jgi:CO/xanthine dehydrogenase Mo-binding subunit